MKWPLLILALAPYSAHAFDLYGEWSGSVNPSHGWSYGYRDSLGGQFQLFDERANENHFHFWRSSNQDIGPSIGRNEDGNQQHGVPAGFIGLLPRMGKFVSVSKFESVGRLDHHLYWNIQTLGNSRTDVIIRRNGQVLFAAMDSNVNVTGGIWFSNVSAVYELLIGPGTDGSDGDARFLYNRDFKISVPEPGGFLAAVFGAFTFALFRRNRGS